MKTSAQLEAWAGDAFACDVVVDALQDVLEARGRPLGALAPDTRLAALGLDSRDIAEFFVRLEERTGTVVDPSSAGGLEVVGDLRRLRLVPATGSRASR
jgi:acyl carrier protein